VDSITQAVLGAAVAEAGFRRELGRKAVFFGAICGTLPDLDIFTAAIDPWFELEHHRGVTHSLLVLPLVSPLVGWLGWRGLRGKGRWTTWAHCAFWALITHPLLDVCTSYGTQLLAPLSRSRFAVDCVSIVDPVYTLPLVFATVLALRKGEGAVRQRSRRAAWAALGWGLCWLGVGAVNHGIVAERFETALAEAGVEPVHTRVMPTLLNHFAFRVAAKDTAGALHVGTMSVLADVPPELVRIAPVADPAIDLALAHPNGQLIAWFADGLLRVRVDHEGDQTVVRLDDQRYGLYQQPEQALWGARAVVQNGVVKELRRTNNRDAGRMRGQLAALWRLVWTGRTGG
jgi:inner membrane protein